jgi:hypothetical protein
MPAWSGLERRSVPRAALGGGFDCRLVMRARVQVLDVSLTGALLATETPLPPGAVGHLSTALAGSPFAPVVEVVRQAPSHAGRQVGTKFHAMEDHPRHVLESFLSKASN